MRAAGSAREKRPGVYEFRIRLGRDPVSGIEIRRSHTWYGSKRDVGKALAQWVADETAENRREPTRENVAWLVDRWLDLQRDAGIAPETLRTYRSYTKNWIVPHLGQVPISKLTAGHLRELHAAMTRAGRKPATVRQVHAIIRGSLTFAMEREWIDRNMAAVRRAPKSPPSDVVACTDAELVALLARAGSEGDDLWTAIALGATLGRRLGQLCDIRWSDVNLDARTVMMSPTRKSPLARAIPIDVETTDVLKLRHEFQEARYARVFGGPRPRQAIADPFVLSFVSDGSAPNPQSYTAKFTLVRDALKASHLHFHCLRHWCATTLINRGVPLPVVAERLGHSSPAVTARIYTHVVAGQDGKAAAILGSALQLKRGK